MINESLKVVGLVKVLDGSDAFISVEIEITNPTLIDQLKQGLIDTLSLRAKLDPLKSINLRSRSKHPRKPSELEQQILDLIENGKTPPRGTTGKNVSNALTRLRRNGLIKNLGTPSRPEWVIDETYKNKYGKVIAYEIGS